MKQENKDELLNTNYTILYELLDVDELAEYYVFKGCKQLTKKSLTKSEVYDYLLERNMYITDISISQDRQFILNVERA